MERYAPWRRIPDDPQTALGWFLPLGFRGRTDAERRRLAFMGSLAAVALLGAWIAHHPVLFVGFVANFVGTFFLTRPEARLHAAIPTLDEGTDAAPVILSIFDTDGRRTGKEMGWAAFADGWLVYEGLRTGFALNRKAARDATYLPGGLIVTLADGRRVEFRELDSLQLGPLPARVGSVARLAKEAREWAREPNAPGSALLPPRRVHPEVATGRLALPLVGALFALFAGSLAFWGEFAKLGSGCLVVALGCFVWFAVALRRFQEALPSMIESSVPIE